MKLNLAKELAALEQMTVGQLQQRYAEVFGEPVRSRHKQYLIRRIAWRLQANAEGGLSERALRRAEELADVADVRVTPPRGGILANPLVPATRTDAPSRPTSTCVRRSTKAYGEPWQYSVFYCILKAIDRVRLENDAREVLNLKEDQLLIVDLGGNEEAAREAATVLGESLPDAETGTVVI